MKVIRLLECHRYSAETFYNVFVKRQPKLVLGLTATFDRLDGRHSLLKHYCPVIDTLTLQEALDNKWLSPYKEYKILIEPDDIEEYRKLNADFFNYFSYFQNNFDFAMKCVTGIRKGNKIIKPSHYVRYEYAQSLCTLPTSHPSYKSVVNSIFKEISAVTFSWNRALQARKSYVANHPKKIEITRKILAARPNSKAITFSATIKQAEKIGNGFIIHSGKTKSKNRITAEEFANVKIGVLHTSKKLDEGADIPGLNLAIILSNTSSKTQKTQRIGHWPM